MITWPDVSTQMNWAQEDGFNPLDPTCHTCGQAVLEGDDCDKWRAVSGRIAAPYDYARRFVRLLFCPSCAANISPIDIHRELWLIGFCKAGSTRQGRKEQS